MTSNTTGSVEKRSTFHLFSPILAGASLRERLWACVGALVGICLTGLICGLAFGNTATLPLIVAPMGASAVLLFAVPASPLAQPWPVVGGNMISALVGVAVARWVGNPVMAIGLAVSLAILAMSFTRSLHPPGGAAALTAVIGGAAVKDAGFWFPFIPVAANSLALVALAVVFHKIMKHNYPHRPVAAARNAHQTADKPAPVRVGFTAADIDAAISDLHETLDIDRNDVDALLRQVEQRALERVHGDIKCRDIMSKDVVVAQRHASAEEVRKLLSHHHLRSVPVVNESGVLLGIFGYDELEKPAADGVLPLAQAATAKAEDAAIHVLPLLTRGPVHNVIIVDAQNRIEGVVSQSDLLVALSKNLLWQLPQRS